MFRLAHFSDPHLGPLPDPRLVQLLSKRIIGYVNWVKNRKHIMGSDYLTGLLDDIHDQRPDHIALTGDLVNIALPLEIDAARDWLHDVGEPHGVSLVPGNHDAYVPGALKHAFNAWSEYMTGDSGLMTPLPEVRPNFPFVRRRGNVAIIGVSTARASGPWFATGKVGVPQARRLAEVLGKTGEEGLFRVVMIHHPPFQKATTWPKRLTDASRVRAMVKRYGAELVLHGHTHINSLAEIEGPNGPVPVVGVPSATSAPGRKKPAARYNLFSIEGTVQTGWTCHMEERGFTTPESPVSTIAERELKIS